MSEEDLSVFFENADFTSIALVDSSSDITELIGYFDEEFVPMLTDNAEGRRITFSVRSDLITEIRHGDELEINSRTFEIVGIEPIGDGLVTDLVLKEID